MIVSRNIIAVFCFLCMNIKLSIILNKNPSTINLTADITSAIHIHIYIYIILKDILCTFRILKNLASTLPYFYFSYPKIYYYSLSFFFADRKNKPLYKQIYNSFQKKKKLLPLLCQFWHFYLTVYSIDLMFIWIDKRIFITQIYMLINCYRIFLFTQC